LINTIVVCLVLLNFGNLFVALTEPYFPYHPYLVMSSDEIGENLKNVLSTSEFQNSIGRMKHTIAHSGEKGIKKIKEMANKEVSPSTLAAIVALSDAPFSQSFSFLHGMLDSTDGEKYIAVNYALSRMLERLLRIAAEDSELASETVIELTKIAYSPGPQRYPSKGKYTIPMIALAVLANKAEKKHLLLLLVYQKDFEAGQCDEKLHMLANIISSRCSLSLLNSYRLAWLFLHEEYPEQVLPESVSEKKVLLSFIDEIRWECRRNSISLPYKFAKKIREIERSLGRKRD